MNTTLRNILLKGLLVVVVAVLLDVLYRYTLYPADLAENCTLMERSNKAVEEQADIIYLGESSNHTFADEEPDHRFISDMLQDLLPSHRVANLDKDACHAGVYYDIMRNIPGKNDVQTAVVTVNLRSFTAEWIYSDLEVPLGKERVMMKQAPALYKRMLLAFKAYPHWSDKERDKIVRRELKRQRFMPPEGVPYNNATDWERAVAERYRSLGASDDTIGLATHYVKCFAADLDDRNPRVRDFDRIVKLCRKRGWHLVLHILPDNEEQMTELVGPALVEILRRNGDYIVDRYSRQGVTVVNNQGLVPDEGFRDRDFPTEHYRQAGRQAIAANIASAIEKQ